MALLNPYSWMTLQPSCISQTMPLHKFATPRRYPSIINDATCSCSPCHFICEETEIQFFCVVTLLCILVSTFDHSTISVYRKNADSSSTTYLLHFTYHFLSWGWNKTLLICPLTILICNIHIHVKRVCILLAVSLTNHFSWNWLPFYCALCTVYHI